MAGDKKKSYTLTINGISKSVKDVTTLEEAVKKFDATMQGVNRSINVSTQTSNTSTKAAKEKTASLTEEEKAEKKLAETIDKVVRARTEANRAQIDANQAAREAQRQAVLEQQAANASANSIEEMRANLALMEHEWKGLDVGSDKFRELTAEIAALNEKIKQAEQSTGDFRRNVGNYQSAFEGIEKFSGGLDTASKTSMGFAQSLLATNQTMALFGDTSEENTKRGQNLQKILALIGIAQNINNNLFKSGIAVTKAATIAETVHTMQVRARAMAIALSTKNTIGATIAQKAFNLVAKANPYVLLAMALLAVAGAAVTYATNTDDATKKTEKYKSSIDGVTFASKESRDAHDELSKKLRDIQIDLDVVTGKLTEYEAAILRVKNAGKDAIDQINNEEQDALDAIEEKYDSLGYTLNWLYLQGNVFKGKWVSDYIAEQMAEQDKMFEDFNARKRKQREINRKEEEKSLQQSAAEIKKINEDNWNENLEGLKGNLAKIQTERLREEQAAIDRNKAITKANKTRNKDEQLALVDLDAIRVKYDKRREDAIIDANKKAADASKAALEKQKADLEKERDLIRRAEDDKTALTVNEFDRRRLEIEAKYTRQREDLQRQLDTDKNLTEKGREAIRNIISNINSHIANDLAKVREDELAKEQEAEEKRKELLDKRIADADRRNSLLLSGLDLALEEAQQKIGEVVARQKGGLNLIDVDATRANLKASNDALDTFITGVKKAQRDLKKSHEETLKNLKEGTPEYEEELQKYAQANLELNKNLEDANKQREANTKASNEVLTDYYADLFGKIAKYAEIAAQAVTSVTDTLSMGLEMQIESLNEQLESITERYDEVKELREDSTARVEDLEQRLRDATSGTAEALKEQLQDEMHNRAELEREEARLQKEKEKREAEIAKKEKQVKRLNMVGNIAQAIANTAMGVTQALATIIWPLNFVIAGLVGAMGAAQVGIMTKQLTKMEDGGLINGPSHANGGARIQGTNIEVEGGEYVINKDSTSANTRLVEFINSARSTVTAADLVGIVPGEAGTPVIVNNERNSINYEALADAMGNIHLEPKVAVTDIIDAQDTVTNVQDLAGY